MDYENTLKAMYSNLKVTHDFILGPCDTDSISFCKPDQCEFTKEEQEQLINEINAFMVGHLKYAHDGYFRCVLVLKAKNYVLQDEHGKIKTKGSALKSSKTEKGLKDFMGQVIDCLLNDKQDNVMTIYNNFIKEAFSVTDISRWTSRKTVSEKVLNPQRTNERTILEAIQNAGEKCQVGDKVWTYFDREGKLKLQQCWTADHDPLVLVEKIYKTLNIFANVIDMDRYPKYYLKKQKSSLEELLKYENNMASPDPMFCLTAE